MNRIVIFLVVLCVAVGLVASAAVPPKEAEAKDDLKTDEFFYAGFGYPFYRFGLGYPAFYPGYPYPYTPLGLGLSRFGFWY